MWFSRWVVVGVLVLSVGYLVWAGEALGGAAGAMDAGRAREALEAALQGQVDREGRAEVDEGSRAVAAMQVLPAEAVSQIRPIYEQSIAELKQRLTGLDPQKDADERRMLEKAIADTEASLAYMLGDELPAAAAGGAEGAEAIRVPAVGDRVLTRDEALEGMGRFLSVNTSAEALMAFAASAEASDARMASSAGAGAVSADRPLAALAALLRAHELEPREPRHLVNLGAVASRLGLPRHALAVLAAAEGLDEVGARRAGMRAVLLVNRGHALLRAGRAGEAEAVLHEAAALDPALSEAGLNLAHALYRQDTPEKREQAVALLVEGVEDGSKLPRGAEGVEVDRAEPGAGWVGLFRPVEDGSRSALAVRPVEGGGVWVIATFSY